MRDRITPAQIRSARGMLNWSMLDFASAAGISISTVKRLEAGQDHIVSDATAMIVRSTFERAGVNFIGDGRTEIGVVLVVPASAAGFADDTGAMEGSPG